MPIPFKFGAKSPGSPGTASACPTNRGPCRHHAPVGGAPTVQVRMSCERHLSKTGFHVKIIRARIPVTGFLPCRPSLARPVPFFVDSTGHSCVRQPADPVQRTVRHIPSRFGGCAETIADTPGTVEGQTQLQGERFMAPDACPFGLADPGVPFSPAGSFDWPQGPRPSGEGPQAPAMLRSKCRSLPSQAPAGFVRAWRSRQSSR